MVDQDVSLVWHYTTASGLLGMLEHRQIWATHASFMNDKLEGFIMREALAEFIAKDEGLATGDRELVKMQHELIFDQSFRNLSNVEAGNLFLACASKDGDSLTLWRNYAREAVSFAVGIASSAPLGVIPPKEHIPRYSDTLGWSDVEYVEDATKLPELRADEIREASREEDMGDRIVRVSEALARTLAETKDAAFRDERESRFSLIVDSPSLWRFRAGRFGITPYVALGTTSKWGLISSGKDPLPIAAIRLSASATSADHLALNAALESNGFGGGVEVEEHEPADGESGWTQMTEHEPPVRLYQASNSLRH